MLGRIRRSRPALAAIGVCALLVLASIAVPAFGGPSDVNALGAAKKVKKKVSALTLARNADKLSKAADKRSRQALKRTLTPGPKGDAGPPGPANPNADKLDGLDASGISRVAHAGSTGSALEGKDGQAVAASIVAPSAGFLVVTASSDLLRALPTVDSVNCWISVDGVEIKSSERTMNLDDTALGSEDNCFTNGTLPVAAGTHAVALVGDSVSEGTVFDEADISAIFVPFDGTGAAPSAAAVTKAARSSDGLTHGNR